MKKTWEKIDIYADKNCLQSKDLDEFSCLQSGETVHIKTIIQDTTMRLGDRVWWLMAKHLTKEEANSLKVYFKDQYNELYSDTIDEQEALNHFKGINSPLNKQEGMDKLLTYLDL